MTSLSYFLAGLTLFLFGLAIVLGRVYQRWVGLMAAVSGAAFMYDGAVVVAYQGFVPSIIRVVGLLVLAVGAFVMAAFMWRYGNRRRIARRGSTLPGPAPAGQHTLKVLRWGCILLPSPLPVSPERETGPFDLLLDERPECLSAHRGHVGNI